MVTRKLADYVPVSITVSLNRFTIYNKKTHGNMFDNTNLWRLEIFFALICAIGLNAQYGVCWGQSDRLEIPVLFQTTSVPNPAGQPVPRITVQPPPGEYSPAAGWHIEMRPSERGSNHSKLIIRVPSNIDEIEIVPIHQLDMPSMARVTIDYPLSTANQGDQVSTNCQINKITGISESDRAATKAYCHVPPAKLEEAILDSETQGNGRIVKNPFFKSNAAAPLQHLSSSRDQTLTDLARLGLATKRPPNHPTEREPALSIDQVNLLESPKEMEQHDETGVRVQFFDEEATNPSATSEDRHLKFDSAISPASFVNSFDNASLTREVAPIIVNFFDE